MDRLWSLTSLTVVSLNTALDPSSPLHRAAFDRILPLQCLHANVRHVLHLLRTSSDRHGEEVSARQAGTSDGGHQVSHHRFAHSLLRFLNIAAIVATLVDLLLPAQMWHKIILVNATFCWSLGKLNKHSGSTKIKVSWSTPRMLEENLIFAFVAHVTAFLMTDAFDSADKATWIWLALSYAPAACMTVLISQDVPVRKREPQREILCFVLEVLSYVSIWLFGFSPMAQRHFALKNPQTTHFGMDDLQIFTIFFNTITMQCCIIRQKHSVAERRWPSMMAATLYSALVAFYCCVCWSFVQ